jgi:HNH endonuclease
MFELGMNLLVTRFSQLLVCHFHLHASKGMEDWLAVLLLAFIFAICIVNRPLSAQRVTRPSPSTGVSTYAPEQPGNPTWGGYKNGYKTYTDRFGNEKFVHRRVAEKHYGPIPPGCEVHHINHKKWDNRPVNLKVMTKEAHQAYHAQNPQYNP